MIRIRFYLVLPDSDPYRDADPDTGAMNLTKITNKPELQLFKKAFVPT
jgi:hypothetical protein